MNRSFGDVSFVAVANTFFARGRWLTKMVDNGWLAMYIHTYIAMVTYHCCCLLVTSCCALLAAGGDYHECLISAVVIALSVYHGCIVGYHHLLVAVLLGLYH